MTYILFISPTLESQVVSLNFCQKFSFSSQFIENFELLNFALMNHMPRSPNYETEAIQAEKDQQLVI